MSLHGMPTLIILCEQKDLFVRSSLKRDFGTLFKIFFVLRQRPSEDEKDIGRTVRPR